jgi:hypothetical protein
MKAQLVDNVGLYQVCAELSARNFNVMPTARNAKGVDIVGYDDLGMVLEGKWKSAYVWTREEMRKAPISNFTGKDGKAQLWFESKNWTKDNGAVNAWGKITPANACASI